MLKACPGPPLEQPLQPSSALRPGEVPPSRGSPRHSGPPSFPPAAQNENKRWQKPYDKASAKVTGHNSGFQKRSVVPGSQAVGKNEARDAADRRPVPEKRAPEPPIAAGREGYLGPVGGKGRRLSSRPGWACPERRRAPEAPAPAATAAARVTPRGGQGLSGAPATAVGSRGACCDFRLPRPRRLPGALCRPSAPAAAPFHQAVATSVLNKSVLTAASTTLCWSRRGGAGRREAAFLEPRPRAAGARGPRPLERHGQTCRM